MLKITKSIGPIANPKKIEVKASSDSVVGNSIVDSGKVINQTGSTKRKNQAKISKSKILVKSQNHDISLNSRNRKAGMGFFTPETRLTFTQLMPAFVKALIFYHFNQKNHIRIETNALSYEIDGILSQLSS